MDKLRVVFTGGGSGGHVYPLVAVAEELEKKIIDLKVPAEFVYLGPKDAYSEIIASHDIKVVPIVSGKLRRYFSADNFLDAPKFLIGFLQALVKLYFIMPDIVFSKGGTGALPVVMAARFYRIPVAIHDSDAQPGLTNVTSGRFAQRVFLTFERAAAFFDQDKVMVTGAPLRAELMGPRPTKEDAKEALGFDKTQPLTLILGGSQGATRINEFILANIVPLVATTAVLHQTGPANFADVDKLSKAALQGAMPGSFRYTPVAYIMDDMEKALVAADLVIARSGSSVCELAYFGLPAILVPLAESANDHQRIDAYEFAKNGAAVVIEEDNLVAGIFFDQLKKIIGDSDLRAKMSAASSAFFIPGAAEKIAAELVHMIS